LQEITEQDARAEGIEREVNVETNGNLAAEVGFGFELISLRKTFADLWDSIHTAAGTRWEDDPDVWVLEFELVEDER
jgi:hypothetical protein